MKGGIKIISRIPKTIKDLRTKCNYTQKQIADMLQIDRSTYSYYESGRITPDIKTVLKLAHIFNVDYTKILDSEEENVCADIITVLSDSASRAKRLQHSGDNLSEIEKSMLVGLRLLPEDAQKEILKIVSDKIRENRRKDRSHGLKIKKEWL